MRFKMRAGSMKDFLQMADHCYQRQSGFDQHSLVPSASGTELEIGRNASRILETSVCQDNGFVFVGGSQRQEDLICDIGGVPCPVDDLPSIIEQPTQLHTHDPAPVALAFLADLRRRALFSDRMNQFDPVAVDDRKESRLC